MTPPRVGQVWRPHRDLLGAEQSCPGNLVVEATNGDCPFEVACDACGFETAVSRNPGPSSDRLGPDEPPAPADDIPF